MMRIESSGKMKRNFGHLDNKVFGCLFVWHHLDLGEKNEEKELFGGGGREHMYNGQWHFP